MTALCESDRCARGRHLADCAGTDDCEGCERRQAADGLRLCWSCVQRMRRQLSEIPRRWETCSESLPAGNGRAGYVTGTRNPPLPIDLAISARLDKARGILTGWARIVVEERGFTAPAEDIASICRWLEPQCEWLAAHPAANEISAEISETWAILRPRDLPRDRTRFNAGPCPEIIDGKECDGTVVAYFPTDVLEPPFLGCDECSSIWDSSRWLRLGERMLRLIDTRHRVMA